ncbi:hypothetical protein [Bacillus massiliglaciei]|uniref:hypothetical protein n=1 Tax=Bacillus massiliglaciei TaxID=1816693 RepID=UPI000DA5F989|nr:hypothetical protein [Bacillus massiliglaciei]
MLTKKKRLLIITLPVLPWFAVGFVLYVLFGQKYMYAKSFASELYHYPLPKETKMVDKNFDYGVLFGGGPSGNGGYPTVVSYIEVESDLSRAELYDYYNKENVFSAPDSDDKNVGFEIYFDGYQKKIEENGKVWYKRDGNPGTLSSKKGEGKTKAIIQIRTEFSYPFFIDWY